MKTPNSPTTFFEVMLTFYSRKRRNGNWEVCNNQPPKIFKARKGIIDIHSDKEVTLGIQIIAQGKGVPNCGVSTTSNGIRAKEVQFRVLPNDHTSKEFFLTQIDRGRESRQIVKIIASCDSEQTVLSEWELITVKGHKYESTERGKALNDMNAKPLQLTFNKGDKLKSTPTAFRSTTNLPDKAASVPIIKNLSVSKNIQPAIINNNRTASKSIIVPPSVPIIVSKNVAPPPIPIIKNSPLSVPKSIIPPPPSVPIFNNVTAFNNISLPNSIISPSVPIINRLTESNNIITSVPIITNSVPVFSSLPNMMNMNEVEFCEADLDFANLLNVNPADYSGSFMALHKREEQAKKEAKILEDRSCAFTIPTSTCPKEGEILVETETVDLSSFPDAIENVNSSVLSELTDEYCNEWTESELSSISIYFN